MRSVMCIRYCLHDWQTIFIILFSSLWAVDQEKKTYSRQAANSQSMGFAINSSHALSRSRSFITTLSHSSVHFSPILFKGLYQTESYSLHVMQLIRIQTTEEYFYFPHLVVWGRYCACEILIANPIDSCIFGVISIKYVIRCSKHWSIILRSWR
jgi:hypothetical protein